MTPERGDPPGVPAALPADHDDDDGRAPRRPAARARHRARARSCGGRSASRIVGGLLISQVLTLYTTPVVYLYMERLGRWLRAGARRRRARDARAEARRRRREHLGAVHPAADRDLAPRGGAPARGHRWRTRCCPVAPLPRVDFPTIQVSASLPGASPETMASSVATPLERRFGRIAGLTEMTSTSTLGAHVDHAAVRPRPQRRRRGARRAGGHRRRRRRAARRTCRSGRRTARSTRPTRRSSSSRSRRDTLPLAQVFDAANTVLAQKISQVRGVGQVFVGGGQQPAVRVQVDPAALAGHGPQPRRTCATRSRRTTVDQPKGDRRRARRRRDASAPTISSSTRDGYQPLVIAPERRGAVRLGDVADVSRRRREQPRRRLGRRQARGPPHRPQAAGREHHRDQRARPGAPARSSRRRSRRPSRSRSAATGRRRSAPRCDDVEQTLVLSVVLVVVVVFVFLRSRAGDARPDASPCRSRSSARSASCTCSATASTTCR